jgi:PAS domain-containing protein
MHCNFFETHIIEYIEGSLSDEVQRQMEAHMKSCNSCKISHDETLVLFRDFEAVDIVTPSSELRWQFMEDLAAEKATQGKVVSLPQVQPNYWKYAFQIAASVLLLFIGFFMGSSKSTAQASEEIVALQAETLQLKEHITLALMDNSSASKRIQAVNYSEEIHQPNTKILNALIERMNNDSNVNVRLAAAEALFNYSQVELVQDAFIKALHLEKDPSLQIAMIQFLVKAQDKRALEPFQQLLDTPETPDFVKAQANLGMSQII